MFNLRFIKYFYIFLLLFTTLSLAQTEIINGKTISGDERWYGTKIIRGDVTVLPDARLVIAPGTKILFSSDQDLQGSGKDKTRSELIVNGVLVAQGKIGGKILFSSESESPRMGDWYGLVFQKVQEQSILDYCIVEYAYDAITIKKSKIQISNCEIRYNYHSGMSIEVKANPKISRNIISENDYAGIICALGSFPLITENLITLNGIGIVILSSSTPNLGDSRKGDNYNPGKNRILQNEEYDIYNHSGKDILAENNAWGTDDYSAIGLNIYDNQDNNQFGSIHIRPLFRNELENEQVDDLLQLAQNIGPVNNTNQQRNPATNIAAIRPTQPSVQLSRQSEVLNNTATAQKEAKKLTEPGSGAENITSIPFETTPVNQQNEPALMASSNLSENPTEKSIISSEVVNQVNYNDIFLESFLDSRKKSYIKKANVRMNELVRRNLSNGIVRIQVIVNKSGGVETATILKGFNAILDQAALDAAKDFEYDPGTVNGIPVRFRTIEMFIFSRD